MEQLQCYWLLYPLKLPKDGLTLLNFLQNFSTDIQVNLGELLQVANYVSILANGTSSVVNEMERLSKEEAKEQTIVDFNQRPDIPDTPTKNCVLFCI